jgi:DNA-binding beta-propeller fold protein YncE
MADIGAAAAVESGTACKWPLSSAPVRLSWLQSCVAVAEGADVPLPHAVPDASSRCPPAVCVSAVLGDALGRVAVLGGREGMARSLGSVLGGSVTRFLGGGLQGVVSRVIATSGVKSFSNGVAVSPDGSTLVVSDWYNGSHAIYEYRVSDGARLRVVGGAGDGPLRFNGPRQVWAAGSDGFVFVVDRNNHCVQVLTPRLDFHAFVGIGELDRPSGVCANDAIVVVSEYTTERITVFNRSDGSRLRRFGCHGTGAGQLIVPLGLCFTSEGAHVAVADQGNNRVSVFSVDGEFVRHVGARQLRLPHGVACSAYDELVVADCGNRRVVVFSASGEMVRTMGDGGFSGVAIHGCTVFAQDFIGEECVVFT